MEETCPYRSSREIYPFDRQVFWLGLRRRVRTLDLLVLLVVPLVLVVVHLLPSVVRATLVFRFEHPRIVTAYASNFLHADLPHLASNLVVYLLVVPTAYVFSALSGRRRVFFAMFAFGLLVFPVLLSLVHLPFERPGGNRGFSGVSMLFLGYLTLAIVDYLATRLSTSLHLDHAPLLFFASNTAIVLLAVPFSAIGVGLAAASMVLSVVYLVSLLRDLPPLPILSIFLRKRLQQGGPVEFAIFGVWVLLIVLVAGFPSTTPGGPTTVNLFAHVTGYGTGYVVSYVGLRTECSLATVCRCAAPGSNCAVHSTPTTRRLRWVLVRLGVC